jgi:hypothetical protein
MLRLRYSFVILPAAMVGSAAAADLAKPYVDDFSQATLDGRSAVRGDWRIAGGMARCTQDDELYAKNKNHGPVIWYKVPFQDATVKFSFKPEGGKTFVFTINGDRGHVFRFVSTTTATNILAFPTDSGVSPGVVAAKPDAGGHKSLPLNREGPALRQGEWTEVIVEFKGKQAAVRIGKDFSAKVEHAAIAQAKTTVGLGFSFGTLSVKNFSITP